MNAPALRCPAAALLVVLVTSCTGITDPERTYTLRTVNGAPLPVPYFPGDDMVLIQAGELTLGPGSRVVSIVHLACVTPLPTGTTCWVSPKGSRSEGTYSDKDGTITYGDYTVRATFGRDEAVISTISSGALADPFARVLIYRR